MRSQLQHGPHSRGASPFRVAGMIGMMLASIVGTTNAAVPGAAAADITQSALGQQLATEAAFRFTSQGVPTNPADLAVLQLADGQPLVAPAAVAKDIAVSASTGTASASVTIGRHLVGSGGTDTDIGSTAPMQSVSGESVAAAPYWTIRESGCFSLYVDSARFDNCYRILQLINDGVPNKVYWALKQWGTAYESADGLSSLWLYGSRNGGSWQAWEDWGPPGNQNENCVQRWVGIEIGFSTGSYYEVCETWTQTKSGSTASPWLRDQWNCAGWFCSVKLDTRQLAQIMETSISTTATPLYTIGYGMGA